MAISAVAHTTGMGRKTHEHAGQYCATGSPSGTTDQPDSTQPHLWVGRDARLLLLRLQLLQLACKAWSGGHRHSANRVSRAGALQKVTFWLASMHVKPATSCPQARLGSPSLCL